LAEFPPLLGRGLEPHFRVLFSAIFHGVSVGNFHQGRNLWKVAEAKVWSFLVNPPTKFLCVLIILYLPTDYAMLIERNDLPNQLFGIQDLSDLCPEL
jgi:hypothetical protein